MRASNDARYAILGAGCAGLSLAWHLLDAGVTDPILLLDRRTGFPDDRTWCFWDTPGDARTRPFAALATHRWPGWRVYGPDGAEVRRDGTAAAYVRLRAADFYACVLERLKRAPNVTLCLGETIHGDGWAEDAGGVTVHTGGGGVRAEYVFDGRGGVPPGGTRQRFLGQVLRTPAPSFDPACPTLMDFRVSQGGGLRFMYVLPLSATEALVEDTSLGGPPLPAEARRAAIADYARRHLGVCAFAVAQEEAGSIPMSARRLPPRLGGRAFPIGQAGGASKPSSGYTFLRTQAQCRLLAQALAAGRPDRAPRRFAPRRFACFDAAFLAALEHAPGDFPAYFARLFRRVPPDALARFLSETSTAADEGRVIAALPPGPFLRAALASAPQWLEHLWP